MTHIHDIQAQLDSATSVYRRSSDVLPRPLSPTEAVYREWYQRMPTRVVRVNPAKPTPIRCDRETVWLGGGL